MQKMCKDMFDEKDHEILMVWLRADARKCMSVKDQFLSWEESQNFVGSKVDFAGGSSQAIAARVSFVKLDGGRS